MTGPLQQCSSGDHLWEAPAPAGCCKPGWRFEIAPREELEQLGAVEIRSSAVVDLAIGWLRDPREEG